MSWYMFRDAPSYQNRGIKVDGYKYLQTPHLNLSWVMDHKQSIPKQQPSKNFVKQPNKLPQDGRASNVKVMTETSDEQEELIKLIKNRRGHDKQRNDVKQSSVRTKSRSRSSQSIQKEWNYSNQSKFIKNSEFSKRVRYLENSLLPHCRQDNMDTVLDHSLTKEVTLGQSRISKISMSSNNKAQASIKLGDGYNPFNTYVQVKKDLTQKLKEMYEYEDKYKERLQKSHIKLG